MQLEYVLDGKQFDTLEEFYAEVGRVFVGGKPWGENLNALNDMLHNSFGQMPDEFRLVWRHAERSRKQLGYTETVRQLTLQLRDCHPTVLIKTAWALRAALREQGPTVFDWLVTLLGEHSNIELLLVEGD
ncbi:MAG: barstar family protein [Chroococcidiopsidaceae cyanobacterium CP_BM_RX_35]|nr:barstar family protein [Chroococcidiopsidaceae cyanobacterium CP_BM_RX_35]